MRPHKPGWHSGKGPIVLTPSTARDRPRVTKPRQFPTSLFSCWSRGSPCKVPGPPPAQSLAPQRAPRAPVASSRPFLVVVPNPGPPQPAGRPGTRPAGLVYLTCACCGAPFASRAARAASLRNPRARNRRARTIQSHRASVRIFTRSKRARARPRCAFGTVAQAPAPSRPLASPCARRSNTTPFRARLRRGPHRCCAGAGKAGSQNGRPTRDHLPETYASLPSFPCCSHGRTHIRPNILQCNIGAKSIERHDNGAQNANGARNLSLRPRRSRRSLHHGPEGPHDAGSFVHLLVLSLLSPAGRPEGLACCYQSRIPCLSGTCKRPARGPPPAAPAPPGSRPSGENPSGAHRSRGRAPRAGRCVPRAPVRPHGGAWAHAGRPYCPRGGEGNRFPICCPPWARACGAWAYERPSGPREGARRPAGPARPPRGGGGTPCACL